MIAAPLEIDRAVVEILRPRRRILYGRDDQEGSESANGRDDTIRSCSDCAARP